MVDSNAQSGAGSRLSPLAHRSVNTERSGATVSLLVIHERAMAQVFAKKTQVASVEATLGIESSPGRATVHADYTSLPLSPAQWMLTAEQGSEGEFCEHIKTKLGSNGYVSDQSHSRVVFRMSGQNARSVMQKGCRLDLHPSVANAGFCAQTPMAQVGVLLHQVDNVPTYDLHVYSGFADSFWHWLVESVAEFR